MKRRNFILSLAGTAAVGMTGLSVGALKRGRTGGGKMVRVSRSSYALGTGVTLTVYHEDSAIAEKAIDAALAGISEVEDVMSLYRLDSELCQLNRTGRLDNPHPYMVRVLNKAAEMSKQTNGVFDVTVQPLWKLYSESAERGETPTDTAIAETLKKVDWKRVKVRPDHIELEGRDTEITLNGIAQGFAADVVAMELGRFGIINALVDTGEINGIGHHVDKEAWDIGIKNPREQGTFLGVTPIHDRCLATSGDYETRFGNDFRTHHLLDAHSGKSPLELSSVSVAAPTALDADALSTAVFLLGLKEGRKLVENSPGADALFITKSGETVRTDGFPFSSIS